LGQVRVHDSWSPETAPAVKGLPRHGRESARVCHSGQKAAAAGSGAPSPA